MTTPSSTISIRLPDQARRNLDKATKLTRRSRSFLMKEALDRHLADIINEQTNKTPKRRLTTLLGLGGAGMRENAPRTKKEIDQHINWLRDNG